MRLNNTWVSCIRNDTDVSKAYLLNASLHKVNSKYPYTCIFYPDVSNDSKSLLCDSGVQCIEYDKSVKIESSHIVLLHVDTLFLKNLDEVMNFEDTAFFVNPAIYNNVARRFAYDTLTSYDASSYIRLSALPDGLKIDNLLVVNPTRIDPENPVNINELKSFSVLNPAYGCVRNECEDASIIFHPSAQTLSTFAEESKLVGVDFGEDTYFSKLQLFMKNSLLNSGLSIGRITNLLTKKSLETVVNVGQFDKGFLSMFEVISKLISMRYPGKTFNDMLMLHFLYINNLRISELWSFIETKIR